jgi:hydrogenase maturation protein HypF
MEDPVKERLRIEVRGTVQGVGLRPWLARRAAELKLSGHVCNTGTGVVLEIEGAMQALRRLRDELETAGPPGARVTELESRRIPVAGTPLFEIRQSHAIGRGGSVPKDRRPCVECLTEMSEPDDRRYHYPFIACSSCGPRFSLIESMPFDRERTAMAKYPLCWACRDEYNDPEDRRFHNELVSCAACGPRLRYREVEGEASWRGAARALRRGRVVAVKGIGGYQLVCDARSSDAIESIRHFKARRRKPLAVMVRDLAAARAHCEVDAAAAELLTGPEAPIVLLPRRPDSDLAHDVAPGLTRLGVMLPASGLHQLLAEESGAVLVVTSGNRRGEPLLVDDEQAKSAFAGLVDGVLAHDRQIVHMVDDSLVQLVDGVPLVLRHARGFAPTEIELRESVVPSLAVGGHQNAAAAIGNDRRLILGQHVGDTSGLPGRDRLMAEATGLAKLYGIDPEVVIADLHPDYGSTHVARALSPEPTLVQHHAAHAFASIAENAVARPALAVAFDGTGLGPDGTVWGGEFIEIPTQGPPVRRGTWMEFPLPGAEAAIREPRRAALGLCWRLFGARPSAIPDRVRGAFLESEWPVMLRMLERGIRAPMTSSVGRTFDAVAALLGLVDVADFDAEGPIRLEDLAAHHQPDAYPVEIASDSNADLLVADWREAMRALLADVDAGVDASHVAAAFHETAARLIREMASRIEIEDVLLTGGVFQNARLTERSSELLRDHGFRVHTHRRVPANDGGLAIGQLLAASRGATSCAE